jgi:queuine/archaeosine tRNA-ribosyltransferase
MLILKSRLTQHNVHYMLKLMGSIRQAIMEDRYPAFLRKFFSNIYVGDKTKYPDWAVGALRGVGMDLLED